MRVVIVGVDGSDASEEALRWAVEHARLNGLDVEVVAAWEEPDSYRLLEAGRSSSIFERIAHARLDRAISKVRVRYPELTITSRTKRGYAAKVLIDASREAELLVVGSRGHGGFTGMLLGSVSRHCVAHAHCPVVVVRS